MRGFARFVAILLALAIVASGAFAQQSAPAPARGKSEIVVVYWSSDD